MLTIDKRKSFTLIELLVVIAIIGLLSAIVLVSLNGARARARDARRMIEINQVIKALEIYYSQNGRYPDGDGDGCGGWDVGNKDYPFLNGRMPEITAPRDVWATGNCTGYRYYRYSAGDYGCDSNKGAYYVIGINSFEGNYPASPGWSCPTRNWQPEFQWVTGRFENP